MKGSNTINHKQCLGGKNWSECVIGDDLQNSVLQIQKDTVKLAQDVGFKEVMKMM
jgi:sRNA-binding carbon storage regulator CsrA